MNTTALNALVRNVRDSVYIVGSMGVNGEFSISPNPVVHANPAQMRAELRRLSVSHPGKAFVGLRLTGLEFTPVSQSVSI